MPILVLVVVLLIILWACHRVQVIQDRHIETILRNARLKRGLEEKETDKEEHKDGDDQA